MIYLIPVDKAWASLEGEAVEAVYEPQQDVEAAVDEIMHAALEFGLAIIRANAQCSATPPGLMRSRNEFVKHVRELTTTVERRKERKR